MVYYGMSIQNIQQELKNKIQKYEKAISKSSDSASAQLWASKNAQDVRFDQILLDVNFDNKSILDVGCGFGDILVPLAKIATNFRYTGVDMTPSMIKNAKQNHPDNEFIVGDYFAHPLSELFDVIMCSGALNSNFENPFTYRTEALKTMFDHAREAVVFNMSGNHPQPDNKESFGVYYIDSLKILEFCLSLTSKVIFRHHYHSKDFTIVMFK